MGLTRPVAARGYLGPILDTGRTAQDHIGALDPYRLVLSRHTGLPWPGAAPQLGPDGVAGLSLTLDGVGPVSFWHDAPLWQGKPMVPFLQMPWTVIRKPDTSFAGILRRLRPWHFRIRAPSRRLPRNPLALADIVALHPLKGISFVVLASLTLAALPPLAPVLQAAIWVWLGAFALGFLRSLRLTRLRSPLWLRITAGRNRDGAAG